MAPQGTFAAKTAPFAFCTREDVEKDALSHDEGTFNYLTILKK